MLEYIISPQTAERNPWDMLLLGFVISTLAIWFGFWISGLLDAPASILTLAIIVITLAPLIYRILSIEEYEEEKAALCEKREGWKWRDILCIIGRHENAIAVYSFLFIGLVISMSFWFVVLPNETSGLIPSSDAVFGEQIKAIEGSAGAVRELTSGKLTYTGGTEVRGRFFQMLYENNLRVMIMCFLASFLFGAGALWIISWNASVVAAFIGSKIKTELASLPVMHAYLVGLPKYSLSLALWGILEIAAYLVAGLAGGIISVAVAKHKFNSEEFWFTVFDGMFLLLVSVALIFVGAWIEHFFIPVG